MADDRYVLKPLTNDDGKRGYRLEIDEFLGDNEMANLFLIALAEIQTNSLRQYQGKPDWLTYYSLAGLFSCVFVPIEKSTNSSRCPWFS